ELGVTRRAFVRTAASVAPALGIGSLLAACGGSTSTSGQSSGGTPKRGGTLRVGLSGGAGSDTLNPFVPFTFPDYARAPIFSTTSLTSISTAAQSWHWPRKLLRT